MRELTAADIARVLAASPDDTRAVIARLLAASQDDHSRAAIAAARADITPRLRLRRWVRRFDGKDGVGCWDRGNLRLIHSIAVEEDGDVWAHVSVSRSDRTMPDWQTTRDVWWLCYPDQPGLIVVAPRASHVDIAEVSHVWANLTRQATPDFTHGLGTI